MVGEVKVDRLHHAEIARMARLIDGKLDEGVARLSEP
jgi:hypothetical protein